MGELVDRVGIRMLVDGDGLVDNFKNNSLYFYDKYTKSDKDVMSVNVNDITIGRFYHFHYQDISNWMAYSPVFVVDYKKLKNKIIILAINLNFIPLEIRAYFFDKFMIENDFINDVTLKVDYEGAYNELLKIGFEYALVEYDAINIKLVHKISMDFVPRFLISAHPKNKYDPAKLFDIWKVKIPEKEARHKEMLRATLDDFYNMSGEINEKYNLLKNHISRIQTHNNKYNR